NKRKRSITPDTQVFTEDNQRGSNNKNDETRTELIDSVEEDEESEKVDELVKIDDIAKIEEQLKKKLRNEWYVGNINITKKFRQYQLHSIDKAKKGLKWNDTYEILALASIIVLSSPCPYPYEYFTFNEWNLITETNPYKIDGTVIPPSVSTSLHEAAKNVMLGKNVYMNAEESFIEQSAAKTFNDF
ncbi:3865_t:CDS:2, partial [Scutellospora calospora]